MWGRGAGQSQEQEGHGGSGRGPVWGTDCSGLGLGVRPSVLGSERFQALLSMLHTRAAHGPGAWFGGTLRLAAVHASLTSRRQEGETQASSRGSHQTRPSGFLEVGSRSLVPGVPGAPGSWQKCKGQQPPILPASAPSGTA